mmetsp:Transcript_18801/g.52138  ORF Transcript_18801/g.52138 Transcript_18801/m.52138 type:complete len:307 (+) Transcript_18801:662-1582(+)
MTQRRLKSASSTRPVPLMSRSSRQARSTEPRLARRDSRSALRAISRVCLRRRSSCSSEITSAASSSTGPVAGASSSRAARATARTSPPKRSVPTQRSKASRVTGFESAGFSFCFFRECPGTNSSASRCHLPSAQVQKAAASSSSLRGRSGTLACCAGMAGCARIAVTCGASPGSVPSSPSAKRAWSACGASSPGGTRASSAGHVGASSSAEASWLRGSAGASRVSSSSTAAGIRFPLGSAFVPSWGLLPSWASQSSTEYTSWISRTFPHRLHPSLSQAKHSLLPLEPWAIASGPGRAGADRIHRGP